MQTDAVCCVSSDNHIGTARRRPQGSPVEHSDTKSLWLKKEKQQLFQKNYNQQIMAYDFSMGNELCFALFGRQQT